VRLEKQKISKKVHVTFSIPEELNSLLHSVVEKRGLSEFATKALQKALKEERDALKKAYAAANEDPDRKETMDDWKDLDLEGWDE
jgi:metal-responsive CopG/Arc/MetJ family transcriptional regulator